MRDSKLDLPADLFGRSRLALCVTVAHDVDVSASYPFANAVRWQVSASNFGVNDSVCSSAVS